MSETTAAAHLQVLGGFALRAKGSIVLDGAWNRSKALELLKLLAVQQHGSMPRERAMDIVWPDLRPDAAAANLRKNLHYLRGALREAGLSELIAVAGETLVLAPDVAIDLRAFRAAAAEAIRQETSIAAYDEALALYAGELLPGDVYEDWTDGPRQQLARLHARLLEHVSRLHTLRGEHERAIGRLEQLLEFDATNEHAHRTLIGLHGSAGDRERALRQYELCARELKRELGVEPSAETERARQQALDGSSSGLRAGGSLVSRPFVGRETEMATAREAVSAAVRGKGSVLLFEGDAGIGKSRLAAETAAYADLEGAQVLWGRCSEDESAAAYWPWLQVLRSYAETAGADAMRATAGPHAPGMAMLLPELAPALPQESATALDAEQGRFRLFDGIASFLRRASREQPLVVVLDDVHAADPPSISLLEFLSNDIEAHHLLFICAYRPAEAAERPRLSRALTLMQRRFGPKVALSGLSREEVQRLVELTAELPPPEDLVATIWEESEGNPFFVEEITRLLISEGRLETDERDGGAIAIPDTVRELMERRFALLTPAAHRLLRTAAVIGREFHLDLLARVAGEDVDAVLGALEEAEAAHLISELGFGHYGFSHALVRQALYLDLGQTRRTLMHHAIAKAVEELHASDLQPYLALLANHYFAAIPEADPSRAVDYARRAADQATAQAAFEESVRLLQLALRALSTGAQPTVEEECQIMLALGRAQARAGDTPDARATFERVTSIARGAGLDEEFVRGALGFEDATFTEDWVPSGYEPAVSLLEEADGIELQDATLRALVRARRARATFFAGGDHDDAKRLAREAVELSARANRSAQVAALEALHWTLGFAGDHVERRAAAESMLALAIESGDVTLGFKARSWLMVDLLECGDVQAFDAHLRDLSDLAGELRQPVFHWNALCFRASRANLAGDLAEAERLATEALAAGQRARSAWALQAYGAVVGAVRLQQGRLAELEPAIRQLHEQYPEGGAWRASLAFTQAYLGMFDDARAGFEALARENFHDVPRDGSWLITMCVLSETSYILGDRARAGSLYGLLSPFAHLHSVAGNGWSYGGSIELFLGMLMAAIQEWDAAAAHFERAIAAHVAIGSPTFVARTRFDYAQMLVASGTAGRAPALLDEAMAAATSLELADLVERIASFRKSASV